MKSLLLLIVFPILFTTNYCPALDIDSHSELLSFSENYTLLGTVRDSNGEPLENMELIIDGISTGVTTNSDGTFSLDIASAAKSLVVERSGYIPTHVNLGKMRADYNKSKIKVLIFVQAPPKIPRIVFD